MHTNTDYILLSQLNNGSHKAYEVLYFKYSKRVFNFVLAILGDRHQAKDITQYCFLKIWEKRADIIPDGNFESYLFTIARNEVYKETERKIRLTLQHDFIHNDLQITTDVIDKLDAGILNQLIDGLAETLAPVMKKVFLLKKNDYLSNKEIAQMLGVSEKTIETHILRATKIIKEKLQFLLSPEDYEDVNKG